MHDQPSSKMPSQSSSSFDDGSSCEYSFTMIPNTKTSPIHACDASELAHFILVRAGCYMRIGRMNYVVRRALVDGMCLSMLHKGRPRRRGASSLQICVQERLAKTERHSSSVIWQWKETAAQLKYSLGCPVASEFGPKIETRSRSRRPPVGRVSTVRGKKHCGYLSIYNNTKR